jgi:predicted membrane channel-forming protein YqfA (hemolysin III family)
MNMIESASIGMSIDILRWISLALVACLALWTFALVTVSGSCRQRKSSGMQYLLLAALTLIVVLGVIYEFSPLGTLLVYGVLPIIATWLFFKVNGPPMSNLIDWSRRRVARTEHRSERDEEELQ